MYPRSAKFDKIIVNSHTIATRAAVYDYAGNFLKDLTIEDGNVAVQNDAIRRRADVQLTDPDGTLTPSDAKDLLYPVGNEIKLWRGLTYTDGTQPELLAVGVFHLSQIHIEDSGESLSINITAYDRARKVQRAKATQEIVIAKGTNYATAIRTLIDGAVPGLQYNFISTPFTTPQIVITTGDDRLAKAQSMAIDIGCDLFFDPNGVCLLQPVPLIGGDAAWEYLEGSQATILDIGMDLDDSDAINGAVITGEHPDNSTPFRAEAWDTDPNSPTYSGYISPGVFNATPFGAVPTFESRSGITSQSQCQAVANAKLAVQQGIVEQLTFNAIVHPAHEVYDTVLVKRDRIKINNVYVLDRFTLPMSHNRAMNVTARLRTFQ